MIASFLHPSPPIAPIDHPHFRDDPDREARTVVVPDVVEDGWDESARNRVARVVKGRTYDVQPEDLIPDDCEVLDCGCIMTRGWRCPIHDHA